MGKYQEIWKIFHYIYKTPQKPPKTPVFSYDNPEM